MPESCQRRVRFIGKDHEHEGQELNVKILLLSDSKGGSGGYAVLAESRTNLFA